MDEQQSKPELEQASQTPQFNPTADYAWDAGEKFEIDGKTFDILFNFLQSEVNTSEVQSALVKFEAYKRLNEVFNKGIQESKIKEVPKQ